MKFEVDEKDLHELSNNSSGNNQSKTMKLPEDIYNELQAIKLIDKYKFNYEVLQKLVDFYIEHSSEEYKNAFNLLK